MRVVRIRDSQRIEPSANTTEQDWDWDDRIVWAEKDEREEDEEEEYEEVHAYDVVVGGREGGRSTHSGQYTIRCTTASAVQLQMGCRLMRWRHGGSSYAHTYTNTTCCYPPTRPVRPHSLTHP